MKGVFVEVLTFTGYIHTRTVFSRTIFVLFESHGMYISLAWNVYVYTALYVLVFLHSFNVVKLWHSLAYKLSFYTSAIVLVWIEPLIIKTDTNLTFINVLFS